MRWKKLLLKIAIQVVMAILLVWMTILVVHGLMSRKKSDLQPYHRIYLKSEFRVHDMRENYHFAEYLAQEERVFVELQTRFLDHFEETEENFLCRYHPQGPSHPSSIDERFNRTREQRPPAIRGGALLIHGLTDSPYSVRYLADLLYEQGYYVVSLRIPGHGTLPSALTKARWQDWMGAVQIATRHVSDTIGPDQPLLLAGYSNGGALAVLYALRSVQDQDLPCPTRMLLFSPALAVSKFAAMAHQLKALSVIKYFEKSKWSTIGPEYDPFKYNSFPLQAGSQSYQLAVAVEKSIMGLRSSDAWKLLPPILTFQSLVDSTVSVPAVLDFYARLEGPGHELVLFDVNRAAQLENFLSAHPQHQLNRLKQSPTLPYTLTLLTNENPESLQVISKTRPIGQGTYNAPVPIDASWPRQTYSLSHIALLFPPTDPLYGTDPDETVNCVHLGSLGMRGERGLLKISADTLMRLRCNPFYDWMMAKIENTTALP